jgi:chromosome segregation ATPase
MDFQTYASTETTALLERLLSTHSTASQRQLHAVREALDAAARALEAPARTHDDVHELVGRLTGAAEEEVRGVREEAQRALDATRAEIAALAAESDKLRAAVVQSEAETALLRSELETAQERAASTERDLNLTIDAHAAVEEALKGMEAQCRNVTQAKTVVESQLNDARAAIDLMLIETEELRLRTESDSAEKAAYQAELERIREAGRQEREAFASELAAGSARVQTLEQEVGHTRQELDHSRQELGHSKQELDHARQELGQSKLELDHTRQELGHSKHELDHTRQELGHSKQELGHTMQELGQVMQELGQTRQELGQSKHELGQTKQDLGHATQELGQTRQELGQTKHELGQTKQELGQARHELGQSKHELVHAKDELVNAGEVREQRDALAIELERSTERVLALEAELSTAGAARQQHDSVAIELQLRNERVQALETLQTQQEEHIRQLHASLDESAKIEAKLRADLASRPRSTGASHPDSEEAETLRGEVERMVSLFDASARAVTEMARANSSTELLTELVKRLSLQFTRVALFRLKGNRLEGDEQVGFDDTTNMSKLVIPATVDSMLTRAITSGTVQSLTGEDVAVRSGTPFGGTPMSAVAVPIVLQSTTLGVIYADDSDMPDSARGPAVHESSVGFARLLVGQVVVLLVRHTHELKTLAELSQYAMTLLQEAKEMYLADAQAGKNTELLRNRLKDNIDCASQLYTYRAAMEGTAAAALLDEQIAMELEGTTQFARDLAFVIRQMRSADVQLTAEAS